MFSKGEHLLHLQTSILIIVITSNLDKSSFEKDQEVTFL